MSLQFVSFVCLLCRKQADFFGACHRTFFMIEEVSGQEIRKSPFRFLFRSQDFSWERQLVARGEIWASSGHCCQNAKYNLSGLVWIKLALGIQVDDITV